MKENNENRQRNGNFGTERSGNLFRKKDFNSSYERPKHNSDNSNYRKSDRPYNSFKKIDDDQSNFGERKFNNRNNFNRNNQGNNNLNFRKKSFSNDDTRGAKLSFRTAKEVNESKFTETRFDNSNSNVHFRPRKNSPNYDPNAKYSHKKQLDFQKKQILDPNKPIRLNKFIANAGICSRREADEFIKAGVITVNDQIVTELGTKILPTDKIMFHDQPVRSERKIYVLLNKPKDCVTTLEDTHARLTVLDLVKNACSERIYPVGRLDRNTTGVLLLTNDGDLASRLTHPKFEKKKIYHVMLDKDLTREDFEQILAGVDLEDFKIAADALDFVKDDSMREVGIEIHTGQNRVVRRIFEKLGYRILRLDRVYFAGLTKKNLPRGKYRFLNDREVNMLKMGAYA